MLKNDEVFWRPDEGRNAAFLSWGNSEGDIETLWDHSRKRWGWIVEALEATGHPIPSGRIIEFGAGMGFLDDLLGEDTSSIVMLDHTDEYLAQRPHPLQARCRHVRWSPAGLDELQAGPSDHDWVVSIAVFYHLDTATAAAVIRELGTLLRPGGHVLIEGWNPATPEHVRGLGDRERLFSGYPNYLIDMEMVGEALADEYDTLCDVNILLLRKRPLLRRVGEAVGDDPRP